MQQHNLLLANSPRPCSDSQGDSGSSWVEMTVRAPAPGSRGGRWRACNAAMKHQACCVRRHPSNLTAPPTSQLCTGHWCITIPAVQGQQAQGQLRSTFQAYSAAELIRIPAGILILAAASLPPPLPSHHHHHHHPHMPPTTPTTTTERGWTEYLWPPQPSAPPLHADVRDGARAGCCSTGWQDCCLCHACGGILFQRAIMERHA